MMVSLSSLLLVSLLALLILSVTASQDEPATLILTDNSALSATHSNFLSSLKARGHKVSLKDVNDDGVKLGAYGEFAYDNLVLFTSKDASDFGANIQHKDILDFIDAGKNVLIAADEHASEPIRAIANDCGVDFAEGDTRVIDHMSYHPDDENGPHTLVSVPSFEDSPVVRTAQVNGPLLYRGISHTIAEGGTLIFPVLRAGTAAYSGIVNSDAAPTSTGTDTLLITAVQARNNARVIFAGSIDFFSDEFAAKENSGNGAFVEELSTWCFQERGMLRLVNVKHVLTGTDVTPEIGYRIKDDITFSMEIQEYDGKTHEWNSFKTNNLQLEFTMIDPYWRIPLDPDEHGLMTVNFRVPDVPGIFKFVVFYHQAGYSNIDFSELVTVRPFRHDEHERFIDVAYPYYTASFLNMAAFFVFGVVFLYTKNNKTKTD